MFTNDFNERLLGKHLFWVERFV